MGWGDWSLEKAREFVRGLIAVHTATETHGGGGGTPATTVEAATTFGISDAVGADTEYARQDHQHGTPTNPVTAHEAAGDPHAGYRLESAPITNADLADMAQATIKGRAAGTGTGDPTDLTGAQVGAIVEFVSASFVEQGSAPSTPASGYGLVYIGTDQDLHLLDDAATDTPIIATVNGFLSVVMAALAGILDGTTPFDPGALFAEQVGDPATPAAGNWMAFFKAGGLYVIDDAGAVTGPFGTGGGSGLTEAQVRARAFLRC